MADKASETGAPLAAPLWLMPLVVATALFMEHLDSTVIATSLPAIARDLGEDPVILKLAFTSYLLSLAVFIPISGWCADRFGARRVFQAAIAVFTLASIGCAQARGLEELVAARAVQGLGGAMMVPVGRLVLLRTVPKARLVTALAWLAIPALMAPVLGPPVGGFITTYFDWRYIFWINVPVGVAALALAAMFLPDIRDDDDKPLDWKGFILSGLGLSALIFGFTIFGRGFLSGWAAPGLMVTGLVFVYAYWRHAGRHPAPLLDLTLFRVETFRSAVIGGSIFRIGMGAIPFLLPLMLQLAFGLDPFQSGMLTFAAALGAIAMKFTAAPILRRFGFRAVLSRNAFICAGFLLIYALFTAATPHWLIVAVLLAGGFFRSLQFTAINAVGYADIDARAMSRATSLTAVAQQFSLSAGVAFAALALEGARAVRGDAELVTADFAIAFVVVGVVSAMAGFVHMQLEPQAGAEVSGNRIN